jgi:hypothetical protein
MVMPPENHEHHLKLSYNAVSITLAIGSVQNKVLIVTIDI